MTSFIKTSAFLLFISFIVSTACTKENTGPAGCAANFNYALELQAESNALANAASAYGQNQTTENCNAYKATYQAYLDAAADIDF